MVSAAPTAERWAATGLADGEMLEVEILEVEILEVEMLEVEILEVMVLFGSFW